MDSQNAIYDARQLGTPRMLILGVQHLFAMFGATVLVPLLTGLDVSDTAILSASSYRSYRHRHRSHPPFRPCHRRPGRHLPQCHHARQARHES